MAVLSRFNQCFLFNCISAIEEKFVCTFSQNPNFKTFVKVTQVKYLIVNLTRHQTDYPLLIRAGFPTGIVAES